MPKHIYDDNEPSMGIDEVLSLLTDDFQSNTFNNSIHLLECTPITELDSICRSLMYYFAKEGSSLSFLLSLIHYEVEHSDSTTTLFRNNSYATKCFKVYARMIGLPYLFRVIFPLLQKLYKEQQNESIKVVGISDKVNTISSQSDYELNIIQDTESEDLGYEAAIEENALLIQIACESFFNSLKKTLHYCPPEFHTICIHLEQEVHRKYPEHPISLCIASFIFLRYFVAGITVPESFGIIAKRPEPLMRRRLILISKVISNMSIEVKFGDKEVYFKLFTLFLLGLYDSYE